VEWVRFDLERPQTFGAALSGVDRVFLVARPGDEAPERAAEPLLEEARRSGVIRVVALTAMGVERREDFGLRRVERLVESSGLEYTHLRPNWFMQVFSTGPLALAIRSTGEIRLPLADARISYIDTRDIAAVGAAVLVEPGHSGRAYTLTGEEALDTEAVAGAIAGAAGRPVRYRPIGEEEARAAIVSAGLSAERAERLVGFHRLVRAGWCAPVSEAVERVLGRPPLRFARRGRPRGVLEVRGGGRGAAARQVSVLLSPGPRSQCSSRTGRPQRKQKRASAGLASPHQAQTVPARSAVR